jgi:hypothetical protein
MDFAPGFSRRSTHLLCPSGVGAKFEKAREWGTPVVAQIWLAEVARTGKVPNVTVLPGGKAGDKKGDAGEAVVQMDVDEDLYRSPGGVMNEKEKGKAVDKGKAKEVPQVGGFMAIGVECNVMSSHPIVLI